MAIRGKDGLAGGTGGSRAFINNLNRVRKNTNAVSKVIKTDSPTTQKTRIIQKNSVQKVGMPKPANNINSLVKDVKKTVDVRTPAPKKTVAKRAYKLSEKAKRAIDKARMSESDWR